jgi:hypothetical protein
LEHRAEVFGGLWHRPNLNWRDLAALALIVAVILAVGAGARQMLAPFAAAQPPEIMLAPAALPNHALRTTLRMMLALGVSLVFTFTYGMLAANSRRAEMVLVPLLDVLQSVSLLGYLSFTAVFLVSLRRTGRWGPSLPRSLPFLPAGPGIWPSASSSPCAPFRAISTKRAAAFAFPPSAVPQTSAALCSHNRPYLPRIARTQGHWAPKMRFEAELEDHLTRRDAERTLRAVTAWGRYTELFAYDDRTHTFSEITKAE